MNRFEVEVKCMDCGSKDVQVDLDMSQVRGIITFECRDCRNDNDSCYYDDESLNEIVNLEFKREEKSLWRSSRSR